MGPDNYELVPMEIDDALPEHLILGGSDDLSALNVLQSTAVADNFLATIDWSSFDLKLLEDPKIEPSKSDCCPETLVRPLSNNACCNGESLELEEITKNFLQEHQQHEGTSKFLDELHLESPYFYSNPSRDASVQASCSAPTIPSPGETLVNSENGNYFNARLSSLHSKNESDQKAATNGVQILKNKAWTEFSSSATTSFNYSSITHTTKGSVVSIRPSLTTYENQALFKLPKMYYCNICQEYFWTFDAVQSQKPKSNGSKSSRSVRRLDELKRPF